MMRQATAILALATLVVVISSASALASPPHTGCPVGPSDTGTATIGPWEQWNEPTLAAAMAAAGGDPADAVGIFAKNDRNRDGLLCVMTQVLPNDASGSTTFFVPRDNNTGHSPGI